MKSKGEAGEHLCTNPPYGYMKDPDNKKRWIVDPEASYVVKRIFALCLDGYGPTQIARILKEEKVITPTIHFQQADRAARNAPPDNPYNWTGDTIIQRKNGLCLKIPMKQLLTLTHGSVCRNCGRTNAAQRGQGKQICSPALCVTLTAAKNCITAQVRILKRGKTILFVPLQGLKEKKFALLTLSALLYWKKAYWLT